MAVTDVTILIKLARADADSLYGAFGSEGSHVAASRELFDELLLEQVEAEYPDAEVQLRDPGDLRPTAVYADDGETDTVERHIDDIVQELHESGEWIVKNSKGGESGYVVAEDGQVAVQIADASSAHGFSVALLATDDPDERPSTFDGGLGWGAGSWELVDRDDPRVAEFRDRYDYLLDETAAEFRVTP